MPEPLDRATFLRQVADAVDLQPAEIGEVLEELSSHLSDAAAGWRAAGLDMDDAEQRAIRGLGDPATLGRELGRARHERRHLLAAVGGGIFNAAVFGIWSFLTLWLAVGGLGVIALMGTVWVARELGWQDGIWLTGPAGSLCTVAITTAWFAWVGWILPWRVARSARRSVAGVKRAVGIAGFAVSTWLLWTWVTVNADPVLALGLPLGPVAFLLAAQRPVGGPYLFPRTTFRQRLAIALAVVVATSAVSLLSFDTRGNGSMGGGWMPGLERLGSEPMMDPVLASMSLMPNPQISIDGRYGSGGLESGAVLVGGVGFDDDTGDADAAAFARHFSALTLTLVPASIELPTESSQGHVTLEGDPFATTTVRLPVDDLGSAIQIQLPTLRTQTQFAAVLLGQREDGSSVVLGFETFKTPTWHGTLFDWWFTGR